LLELAAGIAWALTHRELFEAGTITAVMNARPIGIRLKALRRWWTQAFEML
jgi:hypothetical protein